MSREVLLSGHVFKMSNTANRKAHAFLELSLILTCLNPFCVLDMPCQFHNECNCAHVCCVDFCCSLMNLRLRYLSVTSHNSILSQLVNLPLHAGGWAGLCALHLRFFPPTTVSNRRFPHAKSQFHQTAQDLGIK